ncbi:cap binding protein [Acrodontium crateriforme]|uniref:Cap binding protein n=1 Tax=Acrodontium crateriforme TaxID=150365 RepID=A0AAQ3M8F1_9PEZI|nr:cap binding protein [Acrodontium crateriforme]
MADYYNGNDRRGGYNKRKRFREDDDEQDRNDRGDHGDRRGDRGGRGGYRNQRQRPDVPPGTKIRRGLLEIAEDPLRLPQDVAANIAKLAADNYDDDFVKDTLVTVVLRLTIEQPLKIPFVAAVVLYANAEKSQTAQDVINRAVQQLHEFLQAGKWREVKLVLRLLACLSPLYEEDGIVPILDDLFGRAVDLQTASTDDAVGIELVKIILLTIPYLLASSTDPSLHQKAAELLEKTDIVASTPHVLESLVDPYLTMNENSEKPMACQSVISLLQRQLQGEASNGWPLKCIPRVYDPNREQQDADLEAHIESNGGGEAKTFTKIAFPTVTIPSPVNPGTRVLFPEVYFSLYADQEIESVPPTSNVASSLLRDAIIDTVNILDFNRNVTARFLNEIDCFWAPDTFVKRATAFDKLRDMPHDRPTWKPEDVTIDAVFSQIFQLPTPEHKLVYYHSLITESCKISPQAIAPSLGRAIRFLFRSVDCMDLELANRFMDWFGHHLSNFEFRWKWTEWIPEVALPELSPRKAFIRGVLDKEIQLSFAKRVRDTLPQEYHFMIPASKENEVPEFKFNDQLTPFSAEGIQVLAMLKKKAPEEEIQKILDVVHEKGAAQGISDPLVASTDIYMTAICSIGSKSLSHVLSTIDRCKDRLLAVGSKSELARRQIISSVVDFWADHPGTAVNIIDKLLNYTIVTPMSVIGWALQDHLENGRALASSQIYDLIAITMFKVTNRVRQVLRERNNLTLQFSQRQQIDEALPLERQGMRDLFTAIENAVSSVANGTANDMNEQLDSDSADNALIVPWGVRWARVWKRKAAVEEAVVGEAAVGPLEESSAVEEQMVAGDEVEDMDQVV